MSVISNEDALKLGVTTKHEIMENGEKRFRLSFRDGSVYIRTEANDSGAWQNSHFHSTLQELYIVQKGWIIFAEYCSISKQFKLKKICEGEYCVSNPQVPHNVYMSANTKTHTVKFGDLSIIDWVAFPLLDELTKHLDEEELIRKCENEG